LCHWPAMCPHFELHVVMTGCVLSALRLGSTLSRLGRLNIYGVPSYGILSYASRLYLKQYKPPIPFVQGLAMFLLPALALLRNHFLLSTLGQTLTGCILLYTGKKGVVSLFSYCGCRTGATVQQLNGRLQVCFFLSRVIRPAQQRQYQGRFLHNIVGVHNAEMACCAQTAEAGAGLQSLANGECRITP
jgi:hypothetical protein